jgi:hypothetical protein
MALEGEELPQFNGSFLFILDLSMTFKACGNARRENNYQDLLRNLEIAALSLSDYFSTPQIENDIEKKLFKLRRELNTILEEFEKTEEIRIKESFAIDLYKLERELRTIWKKSGLQMALKSKR